LGRFVAAIEYEVPAFRGAIVDYVRDDRVARHLSAYCRAPDRRPSITRVFFEHFAACVCYST
jgi:hypothetical protein